MPLVLTVSAKDRIVIDGVELALNKCAKIAVLSTGHEITVTRADGSVRRIAAKVDT